MKSCHFFLFLAVASLGVVARAEDKPAPKAAAKPAAAKAKATAAKANEADANEPRVKAMQEAINTSRQFANPSPEAAAWFGKLRAQRAASKDAEEQAALDTAILFDPAVAATSLLGKEPLKLPKSLRPSASWRPLSAPLTSVRGRWRCPSPS
ncbi:MAG: hypothetical protein RJA48_1968 [Verrucomicrobiota bacterium]